MSRTCLKCANPADVDLYGLSTTNQYLLCPLCAYHAIKHKKQYFKFWDTLCQEQVTRAIVQAAK